MKIGLVCPYNLFKGGGVQECVFALQAELAHRGHDALIVTPQPREFPGKVPDFVRLLGRSTDMKSPFHTTAQISVNVDLRAVSTLLEVENFDLLHFHEPWVPMLSWQILQKSKAKNIATFHAKLPDTLMSKTIERVITPYTKSALKYLHNLTAVSEPAASYVRMLTNKEVIIIPNGIDLKKYQASVPSAGSRQEKVILYIGRLERRKGLKHLLHAAQILQKENQAIKLLIAGDGPDRIKLEGLANVLAVNAEFLGRIDEGTKIDLLRTADVFCAPASYGESFGIVLLEAMASQLPVVAGDNPGYQTVLKGTGRLSLIDPTDTKELARQLDLFMNDQSVRRIWRKWASDEIKQYSYHTIVDQYEKLYKKT